MEKKEDRRIIRSKTALQEALIQLTLERGYEPITVRDLTEKAGVGYATFFRHYADKDALLNVVLQSFATEMQGLVDGNAGISNAKAQGTFIFHYIAEKSHLFRVMLSSRSSTAVLRGVKNAGIQAVLADNVPNPHGSVPAEIAAHHLLSSIISLIQWWLEHDMPYPPEKMGEVYAELIVRPTHEVAFLG